MPLIDPMQLMLTMGATPERSARVHFPKAKTAFNAHMNAALAQGTGQDAVFTHIGGSPLEKSLMQRALQGLAEFAPDQKPTPPGTQQEKSSLLGGISAAFESGKAGAAAIGYDRHGGTSYGTYQIASRPGSMKAFMNFLEKEEPGWAEQLRAAGPANTGSTTGAMPRVWKKLAAESPERFELLQQKFITATHYEPARKKIISRTGLDMDTLPRAAREALWSTAVQHGPSGAARIFGKIIDTIKHTPETTGFTRKLIDTVYDRRKKTFSSSSTAVQKSVQQRMDHEKVQMLALLETGQARQV